MGPRSACLGQKRRVTDSAATEYPRPASTSMALSPGKERLGLRWWREAGDQEKLRCRLAQGPGLPAATMGRKGLASEWPGASHWRESPEDHF